jgi:hypothetical protein
MMVKTTTKHWLLVTGVWKQLQVTRFIYLIAFLLPAAGHNVRAAEFVPLGFGVSSNIHIEQLNVAEDGSVVVGISPEGVLHRWTRQSGLEVLLEDAFTASMSGDGLTIVSSRRVAGTASWEPIKITDEGIDVLPVPADYNSVEARLISQDGSTVFGLDGPDGTVRWADDGFSELPNLGNTIATSSTGGLVVGRRAFYSDWSAYRWTEESGIQRLPSLPSRRHISAFGVSSDGRWTVGRAANDGRDGRLAVRWDGLSPPEPLPHENPEWGTGALDVTADGSRIVGRLYLYSDVGDLRAGLWTEETGMVILQDVLVSDYGLGEALDGWTLDGAYDITDDGRFLVGRATNPHGLIEAFLVDLDSLVGDVNLDGEVNGLDVDPFVEVLLSGPYQTEGDMNEDQVVNGLDVDPFVAAVVGSVQQIPEPSTLLLCLIALGVVGGWRKWGG